MLIEPAGNARERTGIVFASATGVEARLSWAQVDDQAFALSGKLVTLGLGPEVRLVLIGSTSPRLVVAIRAALLAGIPFTVLAPPRTAPTSSKALVLQEQLALLAPAVVICDHAIEEVVRAIEPPDVLVTTLDNVNSVRPADSVSPPLADSRDRTVFLQHTSGTTRIPKAVVVTDGRLRANLSALAGRLQFDPDIDRFQSWLPLYHDMGLVCFLLYPMLAGVDLVVSDSSVFARAPRLWLRWINAFRATVTCAPQFAYGLVGRLSRMPAGIDLSCLRLALNGAEPVDPAGVRRFEKVTAPVGLGKRVMCCGYGLAEATVGVTVTRPGAGFSSDVVDLGVLAEAQVARPTFAGSSVGDPVEMALLGEPLDGVELRIVDDAGCPLPERHVGEVAIRGESVAAQYWRQEGLLTDGDGWFRTSDVGYLTDDQLVVYGRKNDTIIVGGCNLSPSEVERAVWRVDGVRYGQAAAFGSRGATRGSESLVIFAEVRSRSVDLRARIESAVLSAVGIRPSDVVLLTPGELPKTTSGKVQRRACKATYEAGMG
jgi:fatty-acyl-CoA synthase